MNAIRWSYFFIVGLALCLCVARTGSAASRSTYVTPEDIEKQRLNLRVETEAYADGTVRFEVSVGPGQDKISPRRAGRLEIARQDVPKTKDGHMSSVQSPMLWCNVQEVEKDGVLEYSFGVAREALSKAIFEFRNYEPSGMPSMDVYVFRLDEFVTKE